MLAYVEWFSKPQAEPDGIMQMYHVQRLRTREGSPHGGVIELSSIIQPCYLMPRFKKKAQELDIKRSNSAATVVNGDNCLDLVDHFWINSFQDQFTYQSVF